MKRRRRFYLVVQGAMEFVIHLLAGSEQLCPAKNASLSGAVVHLQTFHRGSGGGGRRMHFKVDVAGFE